jgi:hypothetical protein
MKPSLRIPASLYRGMFEDLQRPHTYAAERVGFLFAVPDVRDEPPSVLLGVSYWAVPDDGYVNDPHVGAKINEATIRHAMQLAFTDAFAAFHVHMHDWPGRPSFSPLDEREYERLIPCFGAAVPNVPHGSLVVGPDAVCGKYWSRKQGRVRGGDIPEITIVGFPMKAFRHERRAI